MSRKPSLRPAVVPPVISQPLCRRLQARLAVSARTSDGVPVLVFTAARRPVPRFILPPLILPSPRVCPVFGGHTAVPGTFSVPSRGGVGES